MSSGCIVDIVTLGMDNGVAIDVGNESRQAFLEFVFGADAGYGAGPNAPTLRRSPR